MRMVEEKDKKSCGGEGEWKELVLTYAAKAMQEVGNGLFGKIRDHIEEALARAVRGVVVLCISILGVVFILLGSVAFLGEVTGSPWAGHFIVGGALLVFGLLASALGKKR